MNRVDQIRAAHKLARPKPTVDPAWANSHHDVGILLQELEAKDQIIAELIEALESIDLARTTDLAKDWQKATKLSDAALSKAKTLEER